MTDERTRSPRRGMCAAVLSLEAITLGLTTPVLISVADVAVSTALWVGLGLCVACHGVDGTSRVPGTPHLGGQDRQYLERALSDYRSGKRQQVPMTSLANSLQPVDVQALAAWYAAQPGFVPGDAR